MLSRVYWICVLLKIFIFLNHNVAGYDDEDYVDAPERRVGGFGSKVVSSHDYPFVVSIRTNYESVAIRGGWCSGSIVHAKVVLTAAHCLCTLNSSKQREYASSNQSYVIVGADFAINSSTSRHFHISYIAVRPEYDYIWISDVGVMVTRRSMIVGAAGGSVIPLGWVPAVRRHSIVEIVGYGVDSIKNTNFNFLLRHGEMQLTQIGKCKSVIDEDWARDDSQYICLTSQSSQGLAGDSGGPIVYSGMVVGVLKGGRTPDPYDYLMYPEGFRRYSVAGSVFYYKEWIESYFPN